MLLTKVKLTIILLFFPSICFAQENSAIKRIEAFTGESFTITLESNATTGYSWQFSKPLDKNYLELEGSSYSVYNPGLAGSPGKQVWTINALKAGETMIHFKYVRQWEKNIPPIKEETFLIIIKEKEKPFK